MPEEPIVHMRTFIHGIAEEDLIGKQSDRLLISRVKELTAGKILVGHNIKSDLEVLEIIPTQARVRDTAEQFAWTLGKQWPSLKDLASQKLGIEIQTGAHDSKEDAFVSLLIFVNQFYCIFH